MSDIVSLAALISTNVSIIQTICDVHGITLPAPNRPFQSSTIDPHVISGIAEASSIIVSAAAQLIVIVRPPTATLVTTALQHHVCSSLRASINTSVVEILREAGNKGLHVDQIAKINHVNPTKLARILRLLATEYIFCEVAPNVFANNSISALLDSRKSVAQLLAYPEDRHRDTSGIAAVLSHFTDESFKSSAYLTESLVDPNFAFADDPNHTAFNLAFQTHLPIFPWYELPENHLRLSTFSYAMEGGNNMLRPDSIIQDFPWESLVANSIVVDVGGGIGTQTLALYRAFPSLRFVVQDLPGPVRHGTMFWNSKYPEALISKRVVFKEHDFFKDQPEKDANVYLLRMILHDWSDANCIKILKKIHSSAGPNSKLLIIEDIRPYACVDTTAASKIPGGDVASPPAPLLPNWGHAKIFGYLVDIQMMVLMNGQERTLYHLFTLLTQAGWMIEQIYRDPEFTATHHQILARKIISKSEQRTNL
ncbi:hypothetical protein D9757_006612 [Collybiopsis confluens]|uniref:O-methyltransferase C-terminal domain-containing protein n=1 Tax=Collybiopsis confluens TaxID=2823264 RepID=A0A8H5HQ64_9AGAR|nr:hypothetical protein D9757_006612 [Collybiopsis confluens]